ncbi:phosphohistidine phosphatase SixA [Pseudomonas sp. M47T1]|uniref:phosphohistidine phosphatase SixA n=1 Tax=unclassified Pseudomonas TaxID=196821 RepID=UPI0002606FAF|nr:phosphohistidine phosphatase SixA [Pseudomonas sp. M47T1]EIK94966.1 phosphohistidine phosphatase SixA [Pseudomonas sp. M47T1]
MKLWILRHGEAQGHAARDSLRELTDHGREEVLRSAAHLLGEPVSAVYASPYVRAQQTAGIVHEALALQQPVVTVPWLTPESDPQAVIGHLDALGQDNVLLVSHQPLVGALVGLLEQGHLQSPRGMNTASLAVLEGDWPLAGLMSVQAVHHP